MTDWLTIRRHVLWTGAPKCGLFRLPLAQDFTLLPPNLTGDSLIVWEQHGVRHPLQTEDHDVAVMLEGQQFRWGDVAEPRHLGTVGINDCGFHVFYVGRSATIHYDDVITGAYPLGDLVVHSP